MDMTLQLPLNQCTSFHTYLRHFAVLLFFTKTIYENMASPYVSAPLGASEWKFWDDTVPTIWPSDSTPPGPIPEPAAPVEKKDIVSAV
ncbi:unnamed protein product [Fusarium graminearum]|uniref:Chromosome 2, complete genome n=1 Tax=Gibberella zeae (strain ATCC MYA-4620 / CBS 123657 / FGSC 9075 / NRRL 31084 / PH-1) TaxID=229533 RepID=I1S952_GIBZE|nr:hypothetical protein FGSG_13382 [Fusarium graminearum PH-1]ESU15004.1 hypothetical protein FGSG_13382 [Fusarium graminearum PH-1]EYB21264.1 hypothetical protein FG05_13382 [Fusarium graminearum]CEF76672.1 unnamed protein product [Fusarium graminearum]CZS79964.1 unnamed protein product [Fusarium graminearum]|eukprot:XP_011320429.1 hypothetical protein FGSG_13382 [Fusarium graminearum PH-1]